MNWFGYEVGVQVVCVSELVFIDINGDDQSHLINELPKVGTVYTIREVDVKRYYDNDYLVGLHLKEIINPEVNFRLPPISDGMDEPWFDAHAFQPLVSNHIKEMRKLLVEPPQEKEPANVEKEKEREKVCGDFAISSDSCTV